MVQDFPLSATAPNGSAAIATSEPASIPLSRDTVRSSLNSLPMGRHRATHIIMLRNRLGGRAVCVVQRIDCNLGRGHRKIVPSHWGELSRHRVKAETG